MKDQKSIETSAKLDESECSDEIVKGDRPFLLEHIFGFDSSVPIINVTTVPSSKAFISTSDHILQIFRCDGDNIYFVGHASDILLIATNATGRFIVSADGLGIVNVWDVSLASEFLHPLRTIFEPRLKLTKLAMSHDGKYILTTLSDGNGSIIKFWKWSFGDDKPNGRFVVPEKYDHIENIRFSQNECDGKIFAVTASNGIFFGLCTEMLEIHFPSRSISISYKFIDTIFIENSHKAISITRCGSVVLWSDILVEPSVIPIASSFKKENIKSIKLSNFALVDIKSIDDCVVIADAAGQIRFYDVNLKIVHWCPCYDFIDTIITISFDLVKADSNESIQKKFFIRDFLIATKSEIISVNFHEMKFNRQIFYRSEDIIKALDVYPLNSKLICCGNYSGRIFIYDCERKVMTIDVQLMMQKRKNSTSDIVVHEMPHISAIRYSPNGHHLFCGMENGQLISLDPNIAAQLKSYDVLQSKIISIKFSLDSIFMTVYDEASTVSLFHFILEEWMFVGKVRYHTKPICDVLYISAASQLHQNKLAPRLISLGQDRLIVEYDIVESLKDPARGNLSITFNKRIFQTAIPVSMALVYSTKKQDEQLLVADSALKFRIYDKNTFEILHTFLGPIYDSDVKQFDANSSLGLTIHSKFFIFATLKNLGIYALPIDGNPFRSLAVMGHCNGIKDMRVDSTRNILFTIGNKSKALFMWKINFRPLLDHFNESGDGLKPYCELLPGGKYGAFLQDMQNFYYYALMLSNKNTVDAKMVKEGIDVADVPDYMRALGSFPSDYEIECILHEIHTGAKRKISFEEIVKLYINHAPAPVNGNLEAVVKRFEFAIKNLLQIDANVPASKIYVKRENLICILTESAEKIDEKDAERYLKDAYNGKDINNEISLMDLIQNIFECATSLQ